MYPEYIELQGNKRSGTLYKEIIKLQQENQQLQSNWNSLREYVEELYNKEDSWAGCGARYVQAGRKQTK